MATIWENMPCAYCGKPISKGQKYKAIGKNEYGHPFWDCALHLECYETALGKDNRKTDIMR